MWWMFLLGGAVGFGLGSVWMYFLTLRAVDKLIEDRKIVRG